jgi:hypothetical protein
MTCRKNIHYDLLAFHLLHFLLLFVCDAEQFQVALAVRVTTLVL